MKVVYNSCFGGFGLSTKAVELGKRLSGDKNWPNDKWHVDAGRADPILVKIVEQLGDEANGSCAQLRIEDVPKGNRWRIDEYDGSETVMTVENTEWEVAT